MTLEQAKQLNAEYKTLNAGVVESHYHVFMYKSIDDYNQQRDAMSYCSFCRRSEKDAHWCRSGNISLNANSEYHLALQKVFVLILDKNLRWMEKPPYSYAKENGMIEWSRRDYKSELKRS